MRRFTNSIRKSITEENWFSALFLSLALPDICGSLENPEANVGDRYRDWFNRYLEPEYGEMFSADDCYYFRCACLHQGLPIHARAANEGIHFIPPPPRGNIIHLNKLNNILQMQIDRFCIHMCEAVDRWSDDVHENEEIQTRIRQLIQIYPISSLKRFIKFK